MGFAIHRLQAKSRASTGAAMLIHWTVNMQHSAMGQHTASLQWHQPRAQRAPPHVASLHVTGSMVLLQDQEARQVLKLTHSQITLSSSGNAVLGKWTAPDLEVWILGTHARIKDCPSSADGVWLGSRHREQKSPFRKLWAFLLAMKSQAQPTCDGTQCNGWIFLHCIINGQLNVQV